MMTDPMLDPFGALLVELRDDADVATLVGNRVRAEPAPPVFDPTTKRLIAPGDAREKGHWIAFVVLVTLDTSPEAQVPLIRATYGVNCYGTTHQNATAVYGAVAKAIHHVGPRLKASGLGIYQTAVISGGAQDKDPDTEQPVVRATISLIATAQAVTA